MASSEQPEIAVAWTSTSATLEAGNIQIEDSNTHRGSTGELGIVTDNTRQESVGSSSPGHESRVPVDFELLWRLRKYLLLLGTLAVSVTYNAGLTPPGGFWSKNTKIGRHGHYAGDPVLRALFFPRHEVFFYCNATAFAASLVLIILLLSKNVTWRKLWLRSMQLTMILDLFSLMGAYAAGSCRAVKSSIYIWVLVFAVFIYIMIHILVFIRVVPKFVSEKRFVPKWLKETAQSVRHWILSKCDIHKSQRNRPQEKDLEEARKFILMLVTFAATVTYQAGLSPPGGFWAENEQNKIPATSMLRSKNLARYNTFVIFNSTSFVASLVTVILLLSPELSGRGIRSKAVTVCVVVDILGLIGAYAAGSCRSMATSVSAISIAVVVWIFFAILAATFVNSSVADWFEKIKPYFMKCMDKIGRVISLNPGSRRSRNAEGDNSIASHRQTAGFVEDVIEPQSASAPEYQLKYNQQVRNTKEGESSREHQSPGKQQTANEEVVSSSEHAFVNDKQAENNNNVVGNLEGQSTDHNSVANEAMSEIETENIKVASMEEEQSSLVDDLKSPNTVAGTSNHEHQLADNHRDENMMGQSLSTDDHESVPMPAECSLEDKMLGNNHNGATNNLKEEKTSSEEPLESIEIEDVGNNNVPRPVENGNTEMYEVAPRQHTSNGDAGGNPTDEHLKKSRTYLLLLAILAVSLTYQSGLNPPGGFWSQRGNNNSTGDPIPRNNHHRSYHLPGDPVLEDIHHRRYIAFFYLNASAFVASLVMIIMLLNRRMSNKVTKRYALQITMIVDLLALTGSYAMGSCRETKNSIYIWLLVCLVLAYVVGHVLIAIHMIPERCKKAVAHKIEEFSCRYIWTKLSFRHNQRSDADDNDCELGHNQRGDADDKNWERRRNLLLMLAVLAATVTYQAGMNPPGGVWSDDVPSGLKPGDPILQHNSLKRYNVFYYSNSLSFVSSVVITILLVNKESCEHGIKSYALRVCLVVGLVSLLIAYSAGSCRKARESIYLIFIAVAVLIALVAQVLLLSSAQDRLRGPTGKTIERLLQLLFGKEESWHGSTSKKQERSGHPEKKVRKRHKYLMLLAILAASITYQAGFNPPGGFWSDDDEGHVEGNPGLKPPGGLWSDNKGHLAGNPVLLDINPRRYEIFFCFNTISFMASIVVIMFLLNKSARKKSVPLEVLHLIMILDLLALMTAFAAGSCRKFRTSVYVYALVVGVVAYLVIVIFLSSGIAKYLRSAGRSGVSSQRSPIRASGTSTPILKDQV